MKSKDSKSSILPMPSDSNSSIYSILAAGLSESQTIILFIEPGPRSNALHEDKLKTPVGNGQQGHYCKDTAETKHETTQQRDDLCCTLGMQHCSC